MSRQMKTAEPSPFLGYQYCHLLGLSHLFARFTGQGKHLFISGSSNFLAPALADVPAYELRTNRNPMLLLRFVGVLLLRLAARQFCALLFQLPPRFTRLEPYDI